MTEEPSAGNHLPHRKWPEPPPFRPEYDKIVFIEGGRRTDPPPSWLGRILDALGLRPARKNIT